MPRKSEWLLRVPEILDELRALPCPVVDRAVIEETFRLGRRRAIDLLASFGGYQAGRTSLVDRSELIARLEAIVQGETFEYERRRKERLTAAIDEVRRYQRAARVKIPPAPAPVAAGLGDGVTVAPGRLTIEFSSVEDLLGKLRNIALAAAGDFERFEKTVAPSV